MIVSTIQVKNNCMGENGMDYYKIGMRIRAIRKAKRLSQEQLAEMADISVVHMSHIETGNTKMSLAVLVALARALDVSTDFILFGSLENLREEVGGEIVDLLHSVPTEQMCVLRDVLKATKTSIEQYLPPRP